MCSFGFISRCPRPDLPLEPLKIAIKNGFTSSKTLGFSLDNAHSHYINVLLPPVEIINVQTNSIFAGILKLPTIDI
jgi:hypothetical protein